MYIHYTHVLQDLKRLLFDSSVPQTIFLPDLGGGSFPVAV